MGLPVQPLAGTVWTVMTVTGACRAAASFMAHSSAYVEWADPSMPTVIPGISCLLLLGLPLRAARTLLPLSFCRSAGTRDLRARQRASEPDQDSRRPVVSAVPAARSRMSSTRRLGEPAPPGP